MPLVMVRSIVRPEKADEVLLALMNAGFPGATKLFVAGRGKQCGIKIGDVAYDELAKTMAKPPHTTSPRTSKNTKSRSSV